MPYIPEPLPGYARPRAFPFYIVCDVSYSMHAPRRDGRPTPHEVLSNCVGQLLFQLEAGDPGVSEAAHICIVAFSDQAQVILPLTRPCDAVRVPELPKGGQTNYAAVFDALFRIIDADCRRLRQDYELKQPVVFFITDGEPYVGESTQPPQVWLPLRDRLADTSFGHRPHIAAMGFDQVTERSLCQIATKLGGSSLAYVAKEAIQATQVLEGIARAVSDSIGISVSKSEFSLRVPVGMRHLECRLP
ncbi:vWA domain-containing protein [Rhizohabitans arisaemae]|uniref:vWA domain-containing protein n=1 Tax=Rhizohabitans arisaemae TaxID=2720610 RepID=UPI0024B1D885|nr:VWA domain-containing protein [Rhizohabitans arisaemae]